MDLSRIWELLAMMALDVVWPLKGIIYMEEQILQWCVALVIGYFTEIGVIIIILFGIGLMLYSGHVNRYMRMTGRAANGFLHRLWNTLINVLLAWWYLIVGACIGRVDRSEVVRPRMRISLHYRLGRQLFIIAHWCLRFIHNNRVRVVLARVIALVVILWGVWEIPYMLTH